MVKLIRLLIFLSLINNLSAQQSKDIYEWSLKYQPLDNAIIGIWPPWSVWTDTIKLKELKESFGIGYTIIYPDSLTFSTTKKVFGSDMMLTFTEGWHDRGNNYKGLWGYYIDEPIRGNIDSLYLKEMSQWVHSQNSNSLFFSGDYKRTDYLKQISDNYTDGLLYTSYSNWYKFIAWWIPGSDDQRDSWRDMKQMLRDKFFMTWVNAYTDTSQYDQLFKEAKALALTGIWLYFHESEINYRTLELFCEALVKHGYMKKVYGWKKKKVVDGKVMDVDYNPK